jgi:single-strand DNA-binding protein
LKEFAKAGSIDLHLNPSGANQIGMSVNKVILIGRLGQDPELKYTGSGSGVCNFSVATNESWTDKNGQRQERTEWHRVVVWGKQAELCAQYLSKGREAYLEGKLQTRKWQDQQGQDRYTTEVVAQSVRFLGGAQQRSADQGADQSYGGAQAGGGAPSFGQGASSFSPSNAQGLENPQEPSFTEDDIPF